MFDLFFFFHQLRNNFSMVCLLIISVQKCQLFVELDLYSLSFLSINMLCFHLGLFSFVFGAHLTCMC